MAVSWVEASENLTLIISGWMYLQSQGSWRNWGASCCGYFSSWGSKTFASTVLATAPTSSSFPHLQSTFFGSFNDSQASKLPSPLRVDHLGFLSAEVLSLILSWICYLMPKRTWCSHALLDSDWLNPLSRVLCKTCFLLSFTCASWRLLAVFRLLWSWAVHKRTSRSLGDVSRQYKLLKGRGHK